MNEELHENGGVVLTSLRLGAVNGTNCSYSGDDLRYEHNLLLGVGYDEDDRMAFYGVTIAIHQADAFADAIADFDSAANPPATIGTEGAIKYVADVDASCLICHEPVQEPALLLDAQTNQKVGLHTGCTDACALAVQSVWDYTDELLTDSL